VGAILVLNAGSTSLKLHVVSTDTDSERLRSLDDVDPAAVEAVAHRIVHGGDRFPGPVLVDDHVRADLEQLESLAPLHNTFAIEELDEARRRFPSLPHVAVFDTTFHATIPAAAATYAVPRRWREEWGVRRYGFHGLSVAWSAQRAPQVVGRAQSPLRQVVCHLGGGSSVTAVVDGRSVDTTMGFTPLEGVPMATRSGSVDPGALVAVLRRSGMDADALDHALNEESGMRGLAGGDGLMLELERHAAAGDAAAELAVDVFVHRLAGAVAASLPQALAHQANIGPIGALGLPSLLLKGAQRVRATLKPGRVHRPIGGAVIAVDNLQHTCSTSHMQLPFGRTIFALCRAK